MPLIIILLGLTLAFGGIAKAETNAANVVINEVMANAPAPEDKLEWIELYNPTEQPIDLKGWRLDDKEISSSTLLIEEENFLILARDEAAFKNQWSGVSVPVVTVPMSLRNSSDTIVLESADRSLREEFSWTSDPGENISWERIDPLISANDNWHPTLLASGTPGAKNSVTGLEPPTAPNLLEPANAQELPNQAKVIFSWVSQDGVTFTFVLSKSSDLSDPIIEEPDLTANSFIAEDLEPGFYFWQVSASNGLEDTPSEIFSFRILEPVYSSDIIVNEIYPDPETGEEWLELYNNSASAVDLKNWLLQDLKGSLHQYQILESLVIGPFSYLIISRSQSGITFNNDQDGLRLIWPDGQILSETPIYSQGERGWSFVHGPSGAWQWTTQITPGALNIIAPPVIEETAEEEEADSNVPLNSEPIEIKTGDFKNYENYLVKVKGEVKETSGNTFYLDDGSGRAKIYIQAATGIDKPAMHTGDIFEVVGIVNNYRGSWRILPQKQDDIKLIQTRIQESAGEEASVRKASSAKTTASATTTASNATARSPTAKAVLAQNKNAASSSGVKTASESSKSPGWIQFAKSLTGLAIVFLIILIVRLFRMKKERPLGGDFGNDLT